ncbi:DUF423 domain-containing protein [Inmirania thermothiophila]|uniref:Uncharacterized membrane protein YgdD (TMEM256/DUF423 family) n=1 Tax=Inmirania thermothiophila TaxID=1750597 RepID=A0A3N1Y6I1_9GAMM|nr:DUF423 domain-containing protein [Inmirania thermothiophila]ROR34151.1 uncharacterized membrane protein YgdD (TMEM256/DUF423 family) [Inmirania thermothiophila]
MTAGARAALALAALGGACAVLAGAFAAHLASADAAALLEKGARYQLAHALAAMAVLALPLPRAAALAGLLAAAGSLFAGSLYTLALGAPAALGWVTPVGGTAMVAGWLLVAAAALRR